MVGVGCLKLLSKEADIVHEKAFIINTTFCLLVGFIDFSMYNGHCKLDTINIEVAVEMISLKTGSFMA